MTAKRDVKQMLAAKQDNIETIEWMMIYSKKTDENTPQDTCESDFNGAELRVLEGKKKGSK